MRLTVKMSGEQARRGKGVLVVVAVGVVGVAAMQPRGDDRWLYCMCGCVKEGVVVDAAAAGIFHSSSIKARLQSFGVNLLLIIIHLL